MLETSCRNSLIGDLPPVSSCSGKPGFSETAGSEPRLDSELSDSRTLHVEK
jgi:hypothetical protein